jgi:hypothetical protein
MATDFGGGVLSDGERRLLRQFVESLESLLFRLLQTRRRPLLPTEVRALAEDAFGELKGRQAFETVKEAIDSGRYDTPLIEHGLGGAELRLKMALYESAVREYEKREGGVRGWFRRKTRRFAERALEFADVILGTIASALPGAPGVAAGSVQELKQALEATLGEPKLKTVRSGRGDEEGEPLGSRPA